MKRWMFFAFLSVGCHRSPSYLWVHEYLPEHVPVYDSVVFRQTLYKNWMYEKNRMFFLLDSAHAVVSGHLIGPEGFHELKTPPQVAMGFFWYFKFVPRQAIYGVAARMEGKWTTLALDRSHKRFLQLPYTGAPGAPPSRAWKLHQTYAEIFQKYPFGWFPSPYGPLALSYMRLVVREHPARSLSELRFSSRTRDHVLSVPLEVTTLTPGIWKGDSGFFLTTRSPMNGLQRFGMSDLNRVYVLFLDRYGGVRWKRGYPSEYGISGVIPLKEHLLITVIPTFFTEFPPFLYVEWLDPVKGRVIRHLRVPGRFSQPFVTGDTLWIVRMDPRHHRYTPGWLSPDGTFHPIRSFTMQEHCPPSRWLPIVNGGPAVLDLDGDGRREMVLVLRSSCTADPNPEYSRAQRIQSRFLILEVPEGAIQLREDLNPNADERLFFLQLDRDPLPELILAERTDEGLVRIRRLEYDPVPSR